MAAPELHISLSADATAFTNAMNAATRRLIRSTWAGTDLTDTEYADRLTDAIDEIPRTAHVRESVSHDRNGQISAHGYVAEYIDPATGTARWAEHYSDASGTEYADHPTREAAEAAYEENVRSLQDCVTGTCDENGDEECWWDGSDVQGVPTRN